MNYLSFYAVGEWVEVPGSYNLWLFRDETLVEAKTCVRGLVREMTPQELEVKWKELEQGGQILAEVSHDQGVIQVKVQNRERVMKIDSDRVVFEFSGISCFSLEEEGIAS